MRKVSLQLLHKVAQDRPAGYVEDVLSFAKKVDHQFAYLEPRDFHKLKQKYAPEHGPGTELKKLLAMVGIQSTQSCRCNRRAEYMNQMGCQWCRDNIETIVDWLQEEAENRKMLFLRSAAKMLVNRAIRNADIQQ